MTQQNALRMVTVAPTPTRVGEGSLFSNRNLRLRSARRAFEEFHDLIGTKHAWQQGIKGQGMIVACVDSGLNPNHIDLRDRHLPGEDLLDGASWVDRNGHGTMVSGLVCGQGYKHKGVAPHCKVLPLRVSDFRNQIRYGWGDVRKALEWVCRENLGISVVCLALGEYGNLLPGDSMLHASTLQPAIDTLTVRRIPVVVASGNYFANFSDREGMTFPAILRNTISVGAVFDADVGPFEKFDGKAARTKPGQITPYSQRLEIKNDHEGTTVFAPGSVIFGCGLGQRDSLRLDGTSMATGIVSGCVILIQQKYKELTECNQLPEVKFVRRWLRAGARYATYLSPCGMRTMRSPFLQVSIRHIFSAMEIDRGKGRI